MAFSAVAASAGRLFIGALRYIGGGISAFAKGAVQNTKEGTGGDEQKLSELIRMREKFIRTFGNLPWYWLLVLCVVCLTIGLSAAGIEIKNLQALLESIATEGEKSQILGISTPLATAALILIAESVFGFVIFAAKYSIPFGLRIGVSITAWSMAVIIISGNFTTLQKRDIMAKRATENQHRIVELTRRSQALADRAMANAETAVKATEKNGATSATRAGAVAAANAAEVAREQAIMTRQVADQLRKAPPPSNDEVQGEFWARVLKMLGAVTMFAIQAYAMRLSGLFALMSRQEYVAGRKEVDGAPNLKLPDFTKRKPLPDPPAPAPLPRVDARKLADMLTPEPAPVPPAPTVPVPSARIAQAGRLGTEKPRTTPTTEPAPAPQPEPARNRQNRPEPVPEPEEQDFEPLPEPDRGGEPMRVEPSGRVVIGDRVLADKRVEPVLRALLLSDIVEISYGTANAALKDTGTKSSGMGKPAMLACLSHLESCGYLTRTANGSRAPTALLLAARKMVNRPGVHEPMTASVDDLIATMVRQ